MKHILIFANYDIGLYVFRKELIEELLIQYKVTICVPYGEKVDEFIAMGCEYIEIAVDRRGLSPIKDIALLLKYMSIVKKAKPDMVLTYTIKPNVYGGLVCAFKRIPYIANITGLGAAFEKRGLVRTIATFLYKTGLKKCFCTFFQNSDGQAKLLPLLSKNIRNKLIPGSGVNLNHFQFTDYPADRDTVIFNYVGRIMKIKGIEEFLYCAQQIKSKYPEVIFNVIGEFDDCQYEAIVREYNDTGVIRYLGYQNDMKPFIRECNAIIHAGHSEGMSNVLLEHCAMCRPCIAPNIPGCREIVEHDKNGFLFKVGDVQDMLSKIETFLSLDNEEKARMGYAAREKTEREFDRSIVVKEYLETIAEALTNKGSGRLNEFISKNY